MVGQWIVLVFLIALVNEDYLIMADTVEFPIVMIGQTAETGENAGLSYLKLGKLVYVKEDWKIIWTKPKSPNGKLVHKFTRQENTEKLSELMYFKDSLMTVGTITHNLYNLDPSTFELTESFLTIKDYIQAGWRFSWATVEDNAITGQTMHIVYKDISQSKYHRILIYQNNNVQPPADVTAFYNRTYDVAYRSRILHVGSKITNTVCVYNRKNAKFYFLFQNDSYECVIMSGTNMDSAPQYVKTIVAANPGTVFSSMKMLYSGMQDIIVTLHNLDNSRSSYITLYNINGERISVSHEVKEGEANPSIVMYTAFAILPEEEKLKQSCSVQ